MELKISENGETVFLPLSCVIEEAVFLKEALIKALKDKKVKTFNMSEIRKLDLAGLQIIYSALKTGKNGSGTINLTGGMNEAILPTLTLSGYEPYLEEFRL